MHFADLTRADHDEVRDLILAGLRDHWGSVDASLNPDLDDMLTTYADGRTIVGKAADGRIIATGTVVPRTPDTAEIVRMSVVADTRRTGTGRAVVEELVETAAGWGATRAILETTSAWIDVVAFYLSCGFSITHTADSPFGEDTWFERRIS